QLEDVHTEQIVESTEHETVACTARVHIQGQRREINGRGNGPIDAFVHALNAAKLADFTVLSYSEHSLSQGAAARAVAYIQIKTPTTPSGSKTFYGAAVETDIERASLKAVLSALNRSLK
ncbi:MAG TPA: alpha-isopropylmalate synthase regulatory domain-containing protein, partial [Ktedonobacteraceae bacterium]